MLHTQKFYRRTWYSNFGLLILMSFVRVACFYVDDVHARWSHDESQWRLVFSPGLKILNGKGVFRSDGNYILQE